MPIISDVILAYICIYRFINNLTNYEKCKCSKLV